jgi:hypothetical protein
MFDHLIEVNITISRLFFLVMADLTQNLTISLEWNVPA